MNHTDNLGKVILTGDIVVSGGGKYANIHIGIVTKRNPIMITVNGGDNVNPKECLVITEMYKKSHPTHYDNLYNTYKDHFKVDAKKPNAVMRYRLQAFTHVDNDKVSLVICVLTDGRFDKEIKTLGDFKYGSESLVRTTSGGWRPTLKDGLCWSRYSHDGKRALLPAKIVKKYFGGVPLESGIVETFDNMQECKDFYKTKGVE